MRTLGERYRLDQRLGVGGMSEVWRGHDLVLDRPVAVKLIRPHLGRGVDEITLDRVRTEARSAARLSHPNVASVHDFGMASFLPGQPAPYIVMEMVEGETLAEHLRAGPIDWLIAVRVCAEVCAALAAAHTHGIVHRDIKPANVMLTPSGAKVLDFGIAASIGEVEEDLDGTLVGTPAFVAPERFEGAPATPATDMYAVGVLLYLSLSRRLPWPVTAGGPPIPTERPAPDPLPPVPGLPSEVVDLCIQCLNDDPAARPTSFFLALTLAELVSAQVYVPLAGLVSTSGRPPSAPWDERAASAATGVFDVPGAAAADLEPPTVDQWAPSGGPGNDRRWGRHRA